MHTTQLLECCPRNSHIDEFVDSAISVSKRSNASRQFNSDSNIRQRINPKNDNTETNLMQSLLSVDSTTINDDISVLPTDQSDSIQLRLQRNLRNLKQSKFFEIFYRWCCYGTYLLWFTIGILAIRKTLNATTAVRYVKEHSHTVSEEAIASSSTFQKLLWSLDHEFQKPPAIFLLNQHALNMTFNFLCNTRDMNGVHE
ncbi:unnamed protein product, partial [Acanthocheilonema viteae]